jgi:hypothetical protein
MISFAQKKTGSIVIMRFDKETAAVWHVRKSVFERTELWVMMGHDHLCKYPRLWDR